MRFRLLRAACVACALVTGYGALRSGNLEAAAGAICFAVLAVKMGEI